ncbi:hypothetical protein [Candidatus Magnetomonas plexicatena]|uniref:hypothetical protein n=1 Tax=Candidatus Magnetomonas plexicatena TaxID=2552947 RepID=UPI001C75E318|nr:hypothetical protein E2O03_008135 [Nitrospirales bacterium LBB_01]
MELYDFQKKALALRVINHEAELYFYRKTPSGYVLTGTDKLNFKNAVPKISDTNTSVKTLVSLQMEFFHFRLIELPFSDRDKVLPILPYTMDAMVLGKSDSYVYDFVITDETENSGKKFKAICIYVEKERLKQIVETLRNFNIIPHVITCAGISYVLQNADFQTPGSFAEPSGIGTEAIGKLLLEEFNKKSTINFCRGEFKLSTISELSKKQFSTGVTLLLVSALLITVYSGVKIHLINKRIKTVQSELNSAYREMFKNETKMVDPYVQLQGKIKQMRDTQKLYDSLSPLDVLLLVSKSGYGKVTLTATEMEGSVVTLRGEAESLSLLNTFTEALKDGFSDVKLVESKTGIDSKVKFMVSVKNKLMAEVTKK